VALQYGRNRATVSLRHSELRGHFGLVQPLQRAVVALVQAPGVVHRDPHQVHLLECEPERLDGAFQHRSVRAIEDEAGLLEDFSGALRFLRTASGEVHVGPAGEPVFHVPDRLTVAQQNDLMHMSILYAGLFAPQESIL